MYGYLPVPIKKYHVQMVRQFLITNNINEIKNLDEIEYGSGYMKKVIEDGILTLEFTNPSDNQNIKFYLDDKRRISQVCMVV